jgi:hypothetical protein
MTDFRFISKDEIVQDPATMGAFERGRLVVHSSSFWQRFSQLEIMVFCVRHGIYVVPTLELQEWLKQKIVGETAIEIGSGNGVLAEALSIPGTDNKIQTWPEVQTYYQTIQQGLVQYGPDVQTMSAEEAIKHHNPSVVIAAWVTHRYNPRQHHRKGSVYGVKEEEILRTSRYIFVGNKGVHRGKPILNLPHQEYTFPWLVSRAFNPEDNFIGVWDCNERQQA